MKQLAYKFIFAFKILNFFHFNKFLKVTKAIALAFVSDPTSCLCVACTHLQRVQRLGTGEK